MRPPYDPADPRGSFKRHEKRARKAISDLALSSNNTKTSQQPRAVGQSTHQGTMQAAETDGNEIYHNNSATSEQLELSRGIFDQLENAERPSTADCNVARAGKSSILGLSIDQSMLPITEMAAKDMSHGNVPAVDKLKLPYDPFDPLGTIRRQEMAEKLATNKQASGQDIGRQEILQESHDEHSPQHFDAIIQGGCNDIRQATPSDRVLAGFPKAKAPSSDPVPSEAGISTEELEGSLETEELKSPLPSDLQAYYLNMSKEQRRKHFDILQSVMVETGEMKTTASRITEKGKSKKRHETATKSSTTRQEQNRAQAPKVFRVGRPSLNKTNSSRMTHMPTSVAANSQADNSERWVAPNKVYSTNPDLSDAPLSLLD